jgi:hypothetical protein
VIIACRFKLDKPFQRLVTGMSVCDVMFSISVILQHLLRPAYMDIPWNAIGNTATCSFVGTLYYIFSLAVAFYSALISATAFQMVCHGKRDAAIAPMEKKGHLVAWCLPLLLSIASAVTGTYNPTEFTQMCLYGSYPLGCGSDDGVEECERGQLKFLFAILFIPIIFTPTAISIYLTFRVYRNVQTTVRRVSKYDFAARVSSPGGEDQSSKQKTSAGSSSSPASKTIAVVRWQTIRYMLSYLNTFIWPTIAFVVGFTQDDFDKWYFIRVVATFLYPLQGFFNGIIFLFPCIQAWQRAFPDLALPIILRRVIVEGTTNPPPRGGTSSNLAKSNEDSSGVAPAPVAHE